MYYTRSQIYTFFYLYNAKCLLYAFDGRRNKKLQGRLLVLRFR